MYIHHRLRSEIADSRLEGDAAIRLDHKKPVESDGAANVTAQRNADAANFRADLFRSTRDPLAPFELLRAAVERFLKNALVAYCRFPCTTGPNGALPSGQLMRRIATWSIPSLRAAFAMIGSMMTIPCNPPGELCALRGGVLVSTVNAAPAHGLRLVQQRHDAARRRRIAHRVIRTVVANDEHVESRDPSLFREADFHTPLKARARASDEGFLLAADAHHHRSVRLLRQQRRDDHRHSTGDLAAESASGVFADENNVCRD
jgi:hypothetical protein